MIYTITFSPSLEYYVQLEKFKEGTINKATAASIDIGGKGINITKMLANLGVPNKAFGFTGGNIGDEIEAKMSARGYDFDFVRCNGNSRINVSIESNEKKSAIRVVGVEVDDQAIDALIKKLGCVKEGDYVIIAGSAPPSLTQEMYERVVEFLTRKNALVVLEVNAQILTSLLKYKPYLVKITQNELKKTFGMRSVTFQDAEQGGQKIQKQGARNVLIFMATGGAVFINSQYGVYSSHSPVVKGSMYGANEAFTAGLISSLCLGESCGEAMSFATAARLASVVNKRLATTSEIEECKSKIRVEQVRKENSIVNVKNIVEYAKDVAQESFAQKPLNVLDLAVMTQLLYLDLGVIDGKGIKLKDVYTRYLEKYPNRYSDLGLILPQMYPLFEICATGKRYSGITLKDRESIIDEHLVVQFAGITYKIPTGESVVAFKGTDDTIVGWKEDFYLLYDNPTESQILSAQYLDKHFSRSVRGQDLSVVGHSKGGNLALYGAAHAKQSVRNRISSVINFDGPGFNEGFYASENFNSIRDRAYAIVPQLSVIGRLLYHEETSVVVKSCYVGAYQHDMLSWETDGDKFLSLPKMDELSDKVEEKINEVCKRLTMDQRRMFVEGMFSLMYSTNSFTLTELLKNRAKLFSSYFKTDPETRNILFKTFVELGSDKYVRQMLMMTLSEVKIMQRQREMEVQAIEAGDIDKATQVFKQISAEKGMDLGKPE